MVSDYEKLKKKYDAEFDNAVKRLQQRCRHSKISVWVGLWKQEDPWGHPSYTGYAIKSCNNCQKEMARKKRQRE